MITTAVTYKKTIYFNEHTIYTTITKDPDAVDAWIAETEIIKYHNRYDLIVGLDTEWRSTFQHGFQDPVSLLQLCVDNRCLVFQIIHSGHLPLSLTKFLNNPNYTFTGVGISTDVQKLARRGLGRGPNWQSFASNMVDLRQLAAQKYGWSMDGLNMDLLARNVVNMGVEKPENVRISMWDCPFLTEEQVRYASIDAFLSSEMGKVLLAK